MQINSSAFEAELAILKKQDKHPKPEGWQLSPVAVLQFIVGATLPTNEVISQKYIGNNIKVEIAIATLLSDRALLLVGLPGTGKSYLAKLLAIAISGEATMRLQGSAGVSEDAIKYGWNYALLIANGYSKEALVPSAVMNAMQAGKIVRIDELSRINSEVQDALIPIVSEREMLINELNEKVIAKEGFQLIATANNKDIGIYDLSAALKRRFNVVTLSPPKTIDEERQIVLNNIQQLLLANNPVVFDETLNDLITLFSSIRELIEKNQITTYNSSFSTAELISLFNTLLLHSQYFATTENLHLFLEHELKKIGDKEDEFIKNKIATYLSKL